MLSDSERGNLIDAIQRAQRELDMLMFDEIMTGLPTPPATEREVAEYQRDCGFNLPPSFRAFLLRHDGWPDFLGDAAILGANWRKLDWTAAALAVRKAPFDEFGTEDPFGHGAIPVLLGRSAFVTLFLWPPDPRRLPFREYQYSELIMEHEDFDGFLQSSLESLLNLIDEERQGSDADDDDDK